MPWLLRWLAGVAAAVVLLTLNASPSIATTIQTAGSRIPWSGGNWYLQGANYPWVNYGNDFGSNAFGAYGVHASATKATVDADFAAMSADGIHVARWFVFNDGRAGITFSSGLPTGMDTYVFQDLDAAVQIATKYNIYLNLVLLDFGWMENATFVNGAQLGGHASVINTTAGQQALINNVFVPVFQRYSNNAQIISWEVMNEPEWAITEDGAVNSNVSQPSSLANFRSFTTQVAAAVHTYTKSYVTVGEASMANAQQWKGLGLDFYQIHYYDWMQPYANSNLYAATYASLGLDRPVVVGEFPAGFVQTANLQQYMDTWFNNGYAGTWGWSYKGVDGNGVPNPTVMSNFASAHATSINIAPTTGSTVSALAPNTGPAAGGTPVTITGINFTGATAVAFGAAAAATFAVNSATQIAATSPPGSGTVNVTVTVGGGTSAISAADQFTYAGPPPPAPTVSIVVPNSGPAAGGTPVTITGTNFTGATAVKFGTATASYAVTNATQIAAMSPPGSGTVNVTVTTAGGTSAISAADQFTYTGPPPPGPTVTVVSPVNGSTAGGTSVTITGTNFTGATAVKFGSVAATSYAVNNATQITATSPLGSGIVDVTVTTAGGTSATSAADKFTYVAPPTVSSVVPNSGPTGGGTPVIIIGTSFTAATAVKFGTGPATYMVTSATQIVATSPPGSGTLDVSVTTAAGTSASSTADRFAYTSPAAAYTAQSPNRILDTRTSGQTLSGGGSLNLTVAGGSTGVPAGATGVVLNITVTNTTAPSFLTVWPAGASRATVSNLNWVAGETRANLVNVSVGAGGQVSIYNGVGSADVVVDEEGYFAAPSGTAGGYNALPPTRLLDTRLSSQTMSTGSTIDLQILGAGGIPATGVSAVVLNVTATNTATQGYFTVFPSGTARPTASNVNWAAGWTLPNRVIVKVGANGKISIYNGQSSADAVIDVSGYFTDSTASGKFFTQVSPVRVLDTRVSGGTLASNGTYPNFQITGPAFGVPASATAVFLNATVTNTTASSFLTAYPNARPTASDLNWTAGQTIPNSTLATLSSTGTTSFYNGVGSTDLVLDLSGWFS